ncbi:hypothetical protein SUGI_1179300 [Cryptomeria japonica]|nr:hypothetical protein SUGI_1179300 [Cryptomeria japonica]
MADQNIQRIEPEQEQEIVPEREKERDQETGPAKRGRGRPRGSGRGRGRGRGREAGNHGDQGEEDEAAAGGRGRGRGRGRRGGGGGGGKIDFAIRETEAGSNEWRAKCYQAHRETDHVFLNKTAAAVSFDISHIIAIQRGFCKKGGRKGGCYLENASKQLLQDLMDVRPVKSSQKNGKEDLHSAILVISKMLDAFLTRIRSKEDAEEAFFFYQQNPKDTHILQLCFHGDKLSNPRHMREVPGLEEIVQKHLEVLVLGLPDNPAAALPAVATIHSDDEQIGDAAGNPPPMLAPPPEDAPVVPPSARPRRTAASRVVKISDDQTLAAKVTPEKRKSAEDITVGVSGSKKQRKKKDRSGGSEGGGEGGGGEGGGGDDGGADERVAPYLILEIFTDCPTHGTRKSRHYHFAHDCICEAKNQMQQCFDFINLDPNLRVYLNDFQLPPCFREWKNRLNGLPLNS